jgi:hypothetical protein
MKFMLHEDTSLKFSLKFRAAAQIKQLKNGLPLNSLIAMGYGNRYQIFDIEIIQNSIRWSLQFLIAMKFVRQ